jgi:hypothetical protein
MFEWLTLISIEAGAAKILIDLCCPMIRPGTSGGSIGSVQARTRHREAGDEGDSGDGPC